MTEEEEPPPKMREAIDDVLGSSQPLAAHSFDIALATKPKKGLFRKTEESVCLLVKFVPLVDAGRKSPCTWRKVTGSIASPFSSGDSPH